MKNRSFVLVLFSIVALVGTTEFAAAQSFTSQFRRLRVDTMARDAIFDEDDVFDSDVRSSRKAGDFIDSIDAQSLTITGQTSATAVMDSEIDVANNTFFADGGVTTISIEDGSSSNSGQALFRSRFNLTRPGVLRFNEIELAVFKPMLNDDTRDDDYERTDDGFVTVRVFTEGRAASRIFAKTIRIGRDAVSNYFNDDNISLVLPAGDYRIDIRAQVTGDDWYNTVQGQPRGTSATFYVEGEISQGKK